MGLPHARGGVSDQIGPLKIGVKSSPRAWIETWAEAADDTLYAWSRPAWARGLKLPSRFLVRMIGFLRIIEFAVLTR